MSTTSFFLSFSLVAVLCLPAAGCSIQRTCSMEALSSVGVTVVDSGNSPVSGAKVKYTIDGGSAKDCEPAVATPNVFICGYEESGHFVITVTRGGDTKTAEADVHADECHVTSVSIVITMP
jgi:hypothetical protein